MKYLSIVVILIVGMIEANSQQPIHYAPNQLLIRLKHHTSEGFAYHSDGKQNVRTTNAELNVLFEQLKVKKMETLHPYDVKPHEADTSTLFREFILYFENSVAMNDILNLVNSNKHIEIAQPNYLMVSHVLPNDPTYSSQWSLPKIGMPAAWDIMRGNTQINIAVLDVGFKLDHPDFANNKFHQTLRRDETEVFGIWPPHIPVSGEDYVDPDNDPTPYFSGSAEYSGTHGTHVAGIAGARTNNSTGIAGVAWENIIVPVRCGYIARDTSQNPDINVGLFEVGDWMRALDWVRVNNAARVVNMSFGGPGGPIGQSSTDAALNAGIVLVAASGNDNQSTVDGPACNPGVIAVGATHSGDGRCSPQEWGSGQGSNYGSALSIVAPGNYIHSTYFDGYGNDTYQNSSGTSMAAPHVAGAAALILSINPQLSPAQVKSILENTATKVSGMQGQNFHPEYGYGRLNVAAALANTPLTYTFANVIETTTNYGNLLVDNSDLIPSGNTRNYQMDTNHDVRTSDSELPFIHNWLGSGLTEKDNRWFYFPSEPYEMEYRILHTFTVSMTDRNYKDVHFHASEQATINNSMFELPALSGGNLSFRDPWEYRYENNNWIQDNRFISYPTGFIFTNNSPSSYGGVFKDQFAWAPKPPPDPAYINPLYYSLRASQFLTPQFIHRNFTMLNPLNPGDWIFNNWETNDLANVVADPNPQNSIPEHQTTAVVFTGANATVNANYKAHLHSNKPMSATESECPTCPNSQRKLVLDGDNLRHLVYESAGRIYYTQALLPTTLLRDRFMDEFQLDNGLGANKSPCIAADGYDIYVVWNQNGIVKFRKKAPGDHKQWEPEEEVGAGRFDCHPVISVDEVEGTAVIAFETDAGLAIYIYGDGVYRHHYLIPQTMQLEYPSSSRHPGLSGHEIVWQDGDVLRYARVNVYRNPNPPPYGYYHSLSGIETLPLGNLSSQGINAPSIATDDFTKPCVAWTLTDHNPLAVTFVRKNFNGWGPVDIWQGTEDYWAPSVAALSDVPAQGRVRVAFNQGHGGYPFLIKEWDGGSNWIDDRQSAGTGTGEDLHPNTIPFATSVDISLVLPFSSTVHPPALKQLGVTQDNLQRRGTNKISRELQVWKDTSLFSIRLGELMLLGSGLPDYLDWNLGVDTLVLGRTTTITEQFRTENFDAVSGMTLKYRSVDRRRGSHSLASPMTFTLKLHDASNGQALATLGTLSLNSLQNGRRSSYITQAMNAFAGKTVYVQMTVQNSDSTVRYILRNYHHAAGNALPKMDEEQATSWQQTPVGYELHQNYPNPFGRTSAGAATTEISYSIPEEAVVRLTVLNALGNEVRVLIDERKEAGFHTVTFNSEQLPSGVYYYRLLANGQTLTKKMTIVK